MFYAAIGTFFSMNKADYWTLLISLLEDGCLEGSGRVLRTSGLPNQHLFNYILLFLSMPLRQYLIYCWCHIIAFFLLLSTSVTDVLHNY